MSQVSEAHWHNGEDHTVLEPSGWLRQPSCEQDGQVSPVPMSPGNRLTITPTTASTITQPITSVANRRPYPSHRLRAKRDLDESNFRVLGTLASHTGKFSRKHRLYIRNGAVYKDRPGRVRLPQCSLWAMLRRRQDFPPR